MGVNPNAPITEVLEGNMSLPVRNDDMEHVKLPGRGLVSDATDKTLISPGELIDDGVVEYVHLTGSDHSSHVKLTEEYGHQRIPLRRCGKQWELTVFTEFVTALVASLDEKPLTP